LIKLEIPLPVSSLFVTGKLGLNYKCQRIFTLLLSSSIGEGHFLSFVQT
jgi:hypothetical protein